MDPTSVALNARYANAIASANADLVAQNQPVLTQHEIDVWSVGIPPKRIRDLDAQNSWPVWFWVLIAFIVIAVIVSIILLIVYLAK